MRKLWENEARLEVLEKIRALPADRAPQWGRMNAPQMLAHTADQIRMALGEIPARSGSGMMSVWPMNYLMIHVIPWPHGAKGPFEAFTTKPKTWDSDREALIALIDTFCEKKQQTKWPEHPLFGKLSGDDWAALSYKHLSHHLRQFGA
jgi:hypothetical protein